MKSAQFTDQVHEEQETASESDEDEAIDVLLVPKPTNQVKYPRASVSAEAYGSWNKPENFVPRVFPKSEDQKSRISDKLNTAFMFQALEENEKNIVIAAMEEK